MSVMVWWGSYALQPCGITNSIAWYSLEKWCSGVAEPGGIITMDSEPFLQRENKLPGSESVLQSYKTV